MKKKIFKIILLVVLLLVIGAEIFCIFKSNSQTTKGINAKENRKTALKNLQVINTVSNMLTTIEENTKIAHETLIAQKEAEKEENRKAEEEKIKEDFNKVMTLNVKANNIANSYNNTIRIEYGTSYQGRPLEAYLIKGSGANSKTIFMEFEVHGFEDEYANDGKVLVNLGNDVVEYYALNPNNLGDYQMIVVPSANPDGVIEGVNNTRAGNGYCFGRCTAAGYDMNRDFRNGYFQAQETQSLKALMEQYSMDIHLDFHGWENSAIGDQTIVNTFLVECGLAYNKGGRWGNGQGYVIEYTKNAFDAHSAIIEFRNSRSVSSFQVENAINKIMQQY